GSSSHIQVAMVLDRHRSGRRARHLRVLPRQRRVRGGPDLRRAGPVGEWQLLQRGGQRPRADPRHHPAHPGRRPGQDHLRVPDRARRAGRPVARQRRPGVRDQDQPAEHLRHPAGQPAADPADRLPAVLHHELGAGRRLPGDELRQVEGQAGQQGHPEDDVRRRRRGGRGHRGAPGDQGVPGEPGQVPGHRRQDPQGRPAVRPARHRQDAAGPRGRRRGRGAVLLDLRLGLRRDVRRRRRLPGAGPVRAGQDQRAGDHLRGRDRRRRPAPRRRHGRRPRRARADPQPAAGRDGRVRRQGRRHPHRGHQPAGHPGPGAAAPGPVRPADRGGPAGPARPQGRADRARQGQAAGPGHRPGRHRPAHPRLHRRRPGQRDQRGGAAHRPAERHPGPDGLAGGGDRPRHRRPGAQDPGDEREGEEAHRVPRGGPRAGRLGAAQPRPGAQGDDPAARPVPRAHPGAADRGPLHADPLGDDRPAGVRAGRPGRRGARLPRADHRCQRRHQQGQRAGPLDDHRVRHEHEARCGEVRPEGLRAVPRPRLRPPAGLLRDRRHRHRQRGAPADRAGPRRGLGDPHGVPGRPRRPGARADGEGDPGQGRPGPDLRPGGQAPAAQHVRGLRPALAVGQAAGDDPGRAGRGRRRARSGQRQRPGRHAVAGSPAGPGVPERQRQRVRPAGRRAGLRQRPARRQRLQPPGRVRRPRPGPARPGRLRAGPARPGPARPGRLRPGPARAGRAPAPGVGRLRLAAGRRAVPAGVAGL
ncbi:MAG: Cell division protein FtsH, partial [uncultured Corynebacteriales bacterium]